MKTLCALMVMAGSAAVALQTPAEIDPGMKTVVQVAIVCRDVEATSKRWAALLGVDPPAIHLTRPGKEVKVMYRGRPSNGQAKIAFSSSDKWAWRSWNLSGPTRPSESSSTRMARECSISHSASRTWMEL